MDFEAHWKKPIPTYKTSTAPVWKRILAFIIDILIFDFIIASPWTSSLPQPHLGMQPDNMMIATVIVLITLFFAYLVIAQYLIGQTIGMMFLRLQMTPNDSLWRIMVRNMFIIPVFPFILLWIIDPAFLLFTGERLSERWSGTKTEVVL